MLAAELPDFNTTNLDGTSLIKDFVLLTYAVGGAPTGGPVQEVTIPRAAFSSAGGGNCYTMPLTNQPIGIGIQYFSRLVARTASGEESAASPDSNPFGWNKTPTVGQIRYVAP